MKQIVLNLLILFLLIFQMTLEQKAYSQVTIGSLKDPVQGALLDLKDDDYPNVSTKGLNLPRVALQDIDRLYPMLKPSYPIEEDSLHAGIMVYNTVEGKINGSRGSGQTSVIPSIYVWNGAKWKGLHTTAKDKKILNRNMSDLYVGNQIRHSDFSRTVADSIILTQRVAAGKYRFYFIATCNNCASISITNFPTVLWQFIPSNFWVAKRDQGIVYTNEGIEGNAVFNNPPDFASAAAVYITKLCEISYLYEHPQDMTLSGCFEVFLDKNQNKFLTVPTYATSFLLHDFPNYQINYYVTAIVSVN